MASLLSRPADGAVVTTLTAGAFVLGLLSGAVGLLAGLPAWHAAALAVLVPMALSAAGAAALGFVMATALEPYPEGSSSPLAASAPREAAEARVGAAEDRLQRAVEDGAGDDELQQLAVSLHRARLALATVVLDEEGQLPPAMKAELAVAHRGVSTWVRRGPAR